MTKRLTPEEAKLRHKAATKLSMKLWREKHPDQARAARDLENLRARLKTKERLASSHILQTQE